MKNIIFIAPHGTGKGTQCEFLEKEYNFLHLSTGDLIRQQIAKQDDLGKKLNDIVSKGQLVSDDIVLEMLKKYLEDNKEEKGIIFDGYPRTLNQAYALDELMQNLNEKIDHVFYLEISKEEALKRTLGRMICPNCGKSYNEYYPNLQPKVESICDKCQSPLEKRHDDTEEAFNSLFDVFIKQTMPILNYYEKQNILKKIDASLTKEEIFKIIKGEIEA